MKHRLRRDKDGHYQSPVDIIPLLESSGLILEVGPSYRKSVPSIKTMATARTQYKYGDHISAQQLLDSDLIGILNNAIKKTDCDPAFI